MERGQIGNHVGATKDCSVASVQWIASSNRCCGGKNVVSSGARQRSSTRWESAAATLPQFIVEVGYCFRTILGHERESNISGCDLIPVGAQIYVC